MVDYVTHGGIHAVLRVAGAGDVGAHRWRIPASLIAGASAGSSVTRGSSPICRLGLTARSAGGELQVPRVALRAVLSPSFAGAPPCMSISVRPNPCSADEAWFSSTAPSSARWPAVEVARVCRWGGWVVRSAAEECAEESGFRRGSGIVLAGAFLGFGHGLHDTVDVCTAASPRCLSAAGARNWITHGGFLLGMPLIVTKQTIPLGVSIRGRCADGHTCPVPASSHLGIDSH